jgi:hypothetical protein
LQQLVSLCTISLHYSESVSDTDRAVCKCTGASLLLAGDNIL